MNTTSTKNTFFISGTDTNVGKTKIAALLIKAALKNGLRPGYWKPIETGVNNNQSQELQALQADIGQPFQATVSYSYQEPLAPAVAAQRAGQPLDIASLNQIRQTQQRSVDALFVEGAGGLMVPLDQKTTFLDLLARWQMPVILVVANRLGCLNHTLLSVRALQETGIPFAGWVLNHLQPPATIAEQTNLATLTELLVPPIAVIDWQANDSTALQQWLASALKK